jgi:hypothetical protein
MLLDEQLVGLKGLMVLFNKTFRKKIQGMEKLNKTLLNLSGINYSMNQPQSFAVLSQQIFCCICCMPQGIC